MIDLNLQTLHFITCIILTNVILDFKKQRYGRLIVKSNEIKTTWNITNKTRKNTFSVKGSQVPVNDEKLKDPTNVGNDINNFFITIT